MRFPVPRLSLLLVGLGAALVLGHPTAPADWAATADAPVVVHQVSAPGTAAFTADLPLDDPGVVRLQ